MVALCVGCADLTEQCSYVVRLERQLDYLQRVHSLDNHMNEKVAQSVDARL